MERDLLTSLEFNAQVKSYTVQPIMLEWIDDSGQKRTYTPDVFIEYKGAAEKPKLVEVKYRHLQYLLFRKKKRKRMRKQRISWNLINQKLRFLKKVLRKNLLLLKKISVSIKF